MSMGGSRAAGRHRGAWAAREGQRRTQGSGGVEAYAGFGRVEAHAAVGGLWVVGDRWVGDRRSVPRWVVGAAVGDG